MKSGAHKRDSVLRSGGVDLRDDLAMLIAEHKFLDVTPASRTRSAKPSALRTPIPLGAI
jgi:hypothetical protein